jgi:hypothetical protein
MTSEGQARHPTYDREEFHTSRNCMQVDLLVAMIHRREQGMTQAGQSRKVWTQTYTLVR